MFLFWKNKNFPESLGIGDEDKQIEDIYACKNKNG